MHIATLSSQRQITLPKALLDSFSLSGKDRFLVRRKENTIVLEPVGADLAELAGCLKPLIHPSKLHVSYEEAKQSAIDQMIKEKTHDHVVSD